MLESQSQLGTLNNVTSQPQTQNDVGATSKGHETR